MIDIKIKTLTKEAVGLVQEGLPEALAIHHIFCSQDQSLLIIKDNLYQAQRLISNLKTLLDRDVLYLFPMDESVRIDSLISNGQHLIERLRTLSAIGQRKMIIVAHAISYARFLPAPKEFHAKTIRLTLNQPIERDQLVKLIIDAGYRMEERINAPLQVAKRGDIIDVFAPNYDQALRFELGFDQIESIRLFDLDTQMTTTHLQEAVIAPSTDLIWHLDDKKKEEFLHSLRKESRKLKDKVESDLQEVASGKISPVHYPYYARLNSKVATLQDYFTGLTIISNTPDCQNSYSYFLQELNEYLLALHEQKMLPPALDYLAPLRFPPSNQVLRLSKNELAGNQLIKSVPLTPFSALDEATATIIKTYLKEHHLLISLAQKNQIDLLKSFIQQYQLPEGNGLGHISFDYEDYQEGALFPDDHLLVLTRRELFNFPISITSDLFAKARRISNYEELEENDFVVHEQYGIGRFTGIEPITVAGVTKDYLIIHYRDNDKLLVPVESFSQVRKYLSRNGHPPKLNRLSGNEWEKAKKKIKAKIDDLAERLMDLYSKRTNQEGYSYPPDDVLQQDFELRFPYPLTPGQQVSLEEIKKDMASPRPMDRLLCGDVGFGKTEVAFRAAFKAILAGKQVLFLCPTTILAKQHFQVASQRFASYLSEIVLITRFTSLAQMRKAIDDIASNKTKFIIATHRGLSDDLHYPDLGLVIIDEEQRFGVRQKEKLKLLREGIDVLSLTATPIPRTLQFSLIGVRGLSQIDSPPLNRLPVQTFLMERSDFLLKEVIGRELARNGQVFYLYNHIQHLPHAVEHLKRLFPHIAINPIHAQMDKNQIEQTMNAFYEGKIQVLVSTSIIEAGLDVANANTIIIENCDRFGLAQLYQIRGRVGRGDRAAYCYLLYPQKKVLTDEAQKRLTAIKEFTELGSGYHIALRDLTIRGAGDLLGAEQSGFIDAIGVDLYLKLLKEALHPEEKMGDKMTAIHTSAYIPEEYAGSKNLKFSLYKQIISATTMAQLAVVKEMIKDNHGKVQQRPFLTLLDKKALEILSSSPIIKKIQDQKLALEILLNDDYCSLFYQIHELANDYHYIRIDRNRLEIKITIAKSDPTWLQTAVAFAKKLNALSL